MKKLDWPAQQTVVTARIEKLEKETGGKIAVCFRDLSQGRRFSYNGACAFLSASTIKILLLAELLRQAEAGNFSLTDRLLMTKEDMTGGDGILKELEAGHHFSLMELATLMIIVSDNEATNKLLTLVGMENVNRLGEALHLKAIHFGRKMMDEAARKRGEENWIAADDLGELLTKIYQGTLISQNASALMLRLLQRQQQGERLQRYLPEDVPLAHKCGDLGGVENDAGIFLFPKNPYVLVVLTNLMPSALVGKRAVGQISRLFYELVTGNPGFPD